MTKPKPNKGASLWAWVTQLPDGGVSLVGMMKEGYHTPLITRDRVTVEIARPIAQEHRERTGQRVWLRQFTRHVDHGDA